jgi:hypothetical protein
MCSSEGAGGPAVLAALDHAHAALDELAQAAAWALTDDELVAALEAHERLGSRLAGAGLGLVREADGRGLAARLGAPSTADLLRLHGELDTEAAATVLAALDTLSVPTPARTAARTSAAPGSARTVD